MRAALTIALVALSFACSQVVFAEEDKHSNEPGKKKQGKITGTVTKTDSGDKKTAGIGGDAEPYPQIRDLTLWAVIKWGKRGASNDYHHVLRAGPDVPEKQMEAFWADVNTTPAVDRRMNEWHTFYDNIIEVCRAAVPEIPQKAFFGVDVIVNSDKTISAHVESAANSTGVDSEGYAKKLVAALSGLNKSDKIAFPSTSPSMVKFRIQTTGFEELELQSIGNSLGL